MNIQGLSAVITGGASGLGLGAAVRLARAGAKVTILDVNVELGRKSAVEIGGHFVPTDVVDETSVGSALLEAEEINGPARILVNCAGVGTPAKIVRGDGSPLPLAEFGRAVTVNLLGTFNVLSQFAARIYQAELMGEERAVIINTASVAAFDGQIGQAAYAASKGGVVSMTLPVARELARYGIRVATIAPGLFLTPLLSSLSDENRASLERQIPFPSRLGQPDEFAQLVQAIITNPMLNGETIRLDGSLRMAPR